MGFIIAIAAFIAMELFWHWADTPREDDACRGLCSPARHREPTARQQAATYQKAARMQQETIRQPEYVSPEVAQFVASHTKAELRANAQRAWNEGRIELQAANVVDRKEREPEKVPVKKGFFKL
jgi:hypothetical protein